MKLNVNNCMQATCLLLQTNKVQNII